MFSSDKIPPPSSFVFSKDDDPVTQPDHLLAELQKEVPSVSWQEKFCDAITSFVPHVSGIEMDDLRKKGLGVPIAVAYCIIFAVVLLYYAVVQTISLLNNNLSLKDALTGAIGLATGNANLYSGFFLSALGYALVEYVKIKSMISHSGVAINTLKTVKEKKHLHKIMDKKRNKAVIKFLGDLLDALGDKLSEHELKVVARRCVSVFFSLVATRRSSDTTRHSTPPPQKLKKDHAAILRYCDGSTDPDDHNLAEAPPEGQLGAKKEWNFFEVA
jgi:hypothetical protein